MKKFISLLITLTLTVGILASCGGKGGDSQGGDSQGGGLPAGVSGKDAASLILANERLNVADLNSSGSIFTDGATALVNLSEMAYASVSRNVLLTDTERSKVALASTSYESRDGSVVEIDGNVYRWSGFKEYSNSYDYFLNLTKGISGTAESGAKLIDNVKKFVRVVDKWVNADGTEYYLHVEENLEILYERRDDGLCICMRTKLEDGSNVYQVYRKYGEGSSRMVYSPGKICEYSYVMGDFNHNFLAENNKGFWEVVDVGVVGDEEQRFNVSCMVIKNDICYDAFYTPEEENRGINLVKVVSADRATDILHITQYPDSAFVTLNLQGFNGYTYVETTADPDQLANSETFDYKDDNVKILYWIDPNGERVYQTYDQHSADVILNNGNKIKNGDKYADGKIEISAIRVNHFSKEPSSPDDYIYDNGYAPEMDLLVISSSSTETIAIIEELLAETGLSCRRDMDYVNAGIIRAYEELEQFTRYHEWNESPIYTPEDLAKGWENNLAKHAAFIEMYNVIKDEEVISSDDSEAMALNIKFAPITAQTSAGTSNSGLTVTVTDLELTVEDTTLFVVDEEYVIGFALVSTNNSSNAGLIHIAIPEAEGVLYADGDIFKVKGSAVFDIPALAVGEYTLVAYISTGDGIRSSGYTPVAFTSVSAASKRMAGVEVALSLGTSQSLAVSITAVNEIEVEIEAKEYTAESMYEALGAKIYEYAFVAEGAALEVLLEDGSWAAVEESTSPLESGTYRLQYELKNGNVQHAGYVYTVYTAN